MAVPGFSSNTSGPLLGFSVRWGDAGSELLPDRVLGQDTGAVAKPQPLGGIGCNTGSLQRRVDIHYGAGAGGFWEGPVSAQRHSAALPSSLRVALLFCRKMGERGKLLGASLIQSTAQLWKTT